MRLGLTKPPCYAGYTSLQRTTRPKTVLDSGFNAVDSGFLVLDSGFHKRKMSRLFRNPDSLTWGETTQHWSQHCDQGWLTEVVWEEQPSQLLAPRRFIGNGQNDASDEERGETAVFAGCDRRHMKCQPVHRNKPMSGAGLFKAGLK